MAERFRVLEWEEPHWSEDPGPFFYLSEEQSHGQKRLGLWALSSIRSARVVRKGRGVGRMGPAGRDQ